MKIFLDANVLFSAANQGSGIHKLVIYLAEHYEVVTSHYAFTEAHRNILSKRLKWLDDFMELMPKLETVTGVDRAVDIEIKPKDRPILATAIHEKCDYLVTGDKRDFGHLFNMEINGVRIVSPATLLENLEKLHN